MKSNDMIIFAKQFNLEHSDISEEEYNTKFLHVP